MSWYQQEPGLSLRLICDATLDQNAQIIDVGGGASTLVDQLCDRGYVNVSVLDVSEQAPAHARVRLADKALNVEWYETDVTEFKPPQQFALWHDRAVFHFLTAKKDREKYVEVLKHALRDRGCLHEDRR